MAAAIVIDNGSHLSNPFTFVVFRNRVIGIASKLVHQKIASMAIT
jgi:hypothetical protein